MNVSRSLSALSAVLALLALTSKAWAQTDTVPAPAAAVSPVEYRHLLDGYAATIGEGKRVPPAAAARFQAAFERIKTVRLSDGTIVSVDNSAEIKTLSHIAATSHGAEADEDAQDRAQILSLFTRPGTGSVAIDGDPSATAQSVLSHGEFRYDRHALTPPTIQSSWLERFFDWVGRGLTKMMDAIARFLRSLTGGRDIHGPSSGTMGGLASFLKFLFFAILAIAAIGGITYLSLNWYRNGGRLRLSRGKSGQETGLDLGPDERADPLASARRLSENGDHRGAVRLAYIASLRRLAAAGLLVLEPNKTNWEYQRDLRGRSARSYATLLPATGLFDRVWYGRRSASAGEFERMVTIHDALPDSPVATSSTADNGASVATSRQEAR